MGEDQSTYSAQMSETREPEEIRKDIEGTRQELGETVAALAQKADVKAQAKGKVEDVKSGVGQKITGAKETATGKKEDLLGKAREASPDGAASAVSELSTKAREHPIPMALIGAFAAGVIAGRALKR
jgi:hypothetical protein